MYLALIEAATQIGSLLIKIMKSSSSPSTVGLLKHMSKVEVLIHVKLLKNTVMAQFFSINWFSFFDEAQSQV